MGSQRGSQNGDGKAGDRASSLHGGIAFPGNDWIAFPDGDQYLTNLNNPSPQLLAALASLRQQHLQAAADLLAAIGRGKVNQYLNQQFSCPTP